MQVAEDRKWAVDMTDQEFSKEYGAKHPHQDIPSRKSYISYVEPKSRLIDPPTLQSLIVTKSDVRKEEVKQVREIKARTEQVYCNGCGKVFNGKGNSKFAHKATHMKKCKEYLAMR